jgi:hypothetical protein
MTAEQLWIWMATCRDCGKVHEFTLFEKDFPAQGGTWKSEGHHYRPRLRPTEIGRLKQEWDAEQAARVVKV